MNVRTVRTGSVVALKDVKAVAIMNSDAAETNLRMLTLDTTKFIEIGVRFGAGLMI